MAALVAGAGGPLALRVRLAPSRVLLGLPFLSAALLLALPSWSLIYFARVFKSPCVFVGSVLCVLPSARYLSRIIIVFFFSSIPPFIANCYYYNSSVFFYYYFFIILDLPFHSHYPFIYLTFIAVIIIFLLSIFFSIS